MGVSATDLAALTWGPGGLRRRRAAAARREVPLTNAVRRLLERARSARAPGDDPHVLLSPRSRRSMDLARLSRLVQTALIRGGLEDVTLRDIRAAGGAAGGRPRPAGARPRPRRRHPAGRHAPPGPVGHGGLRPPAPAGGGGGAGGRGQEVLSPRHGGAGGPAVGGRLRYLRERASPTARTWPGSCGSADARPPPSCGGWWRTAA